MFSARRWSMARIQLLGHTSSLAHSSSPANRLWEASRLSPARRSLPSSADSRRTRRTTQRLSRRHYPQTVDVSSSTRPPFSSFQIWNQNGLRWEPQRQKRAMTRGQSPFLHAPDRSPSTNGPLRQGRMQRKPSTQFSCPAADSVVSTAQAVAPGRVTAERANSRHVPGIAFCVDPPLAGMAFCKICAALELAFGGHEAEVHPTRPRPSRSQGTMPRWAVSANLYRHFESVTHQTHPDSSAQELGWRGTTPFGRILSVEGTQDFIQ